MADDSLSSIYGYLDTEDAREDRGDYSDDGTAAGINAAYEELYGMSHQEYVDSLGGSTQQGADEAYFRMQAATDYYQSGQSESARQQMREKYGLTGDKLFAEAEKLADIASGRRKTEGEIDAEKRLAALAQGQRGRAMSYGGFDAAEILQRAGRSAQEGELGGEAAIAQASKQAKGSAKDQLEQLLISGEQRAEDKELGMMSMMAMADQASEQLWSNVLGGVFGGIGAIVGATVPGGDAALSKVGASVGQSFGGGTGRYLG